LREALAEFFKGQPRPEPHLRFPAHHDQPEYRNSSSFRPAAGLPAGPLTVASIDRPWDANRRPSQPEAFTPPIDRGVPPPSPAEGALTALGQSGQTPPGDLKAMQVHNTYLVVDEPDGILIVDQHALHERILYDQLVRRLSAGPLERQRLLLPATVPVSPAQRGLLEEHAALLGRLGIEVSDFGPASVAIHAFPSFLDRLDPREFVRDMLDQFAEEDPGLDGERLVHRILDLMACKAAVKAGDPLSPAEMAELLARRADVEKAAACPHGRPTQIRLTLKDLERQFKRV